MQRGYQTTGITYWDHGELVAARFRDLMLSEPKMTWRLPSWFTSNASWIREQLNPRLNLITTYQLWHDCGKPACLTIDAEGKKHYPNHADISADIWLELDGDPEIAELIRHDMDCHLLRPAQAKQFAQQKNALALLTSALAELHANASMFGGFQSDSFKIKWKRLDRCGAVILQHLLINCNKM